MTLELFRRGGASPAPKDGGVRIPTPDGQEVLVDPRQHREDVVARLLTLGVSVRTLIALLPEWSTLIRTTALALPPEAVTPPEPPPTDDA